MCEQVSELPNSRYVAYFELPKPNLGSVTCRHLLGQPEVSQSGGRRGQWDQRCWWIYGRGWGYMRVGSGSERRLFGGGTVKKAQPQGL